MNDKAIAENKYLDQLNTRKYDPKRTPPALEKILTIDDKIVGTLQNYVVFSGLPKGGKSTFITALIASAIHPADFFKMKLNLPKDRRRVCYIDTESGEYDFYKNVERIKNFICAKNLPSKIDCFSVREDHHKVIQYYVQIYLKNNPDCSVLILDGLLDMILNYNDEVESRQLVQFLKKVTKVYNCLIVTVLHIGKKDLNTLGHLGSSCDRYAQSTLLVEKNKDLNCFVLSSKFMRSDQEFDPVAVQYLGGEFTQVDYTPPVDLKQNFKTKK